MTRFRPLWRDTSPAHRRGWYVQDVERSPTGVVVIVGAWHATQIDAQSEARRLEIDQLRDLEGALS